MENVACTPAAPNTASCWLACCFLLRLTRYTARPAAAASAAAPPTAMPMMAPVLRELEPLLVLWVLLPVPVEPLLLVPLLPSSVVAVVAGTEVAGAAAAGTGEAAGTDRAV